jgi:hypothetical protein
LFMVSNSSRFEKLTRGQHRRHTQTPCIAPLGCCQCAAGSVDLLSDLSCRQTQYLRWRVARHGFGAAWGRSVGTLDTDPHIERLGQRQCGQVGCHLLRESGCTRVDVNKQKSP